MSKPAETTTPNSAELDDEQLASVSGGLSAPRDRMGNFEIQGLMSQYNQAETLASSIKKKESDTNSGLVAKLA